MNKIIAYFNYQLTLFITQNTDKNILNIYFALFMSYNATLRQLYDGFAIALRYSVKLEFSQLTRADIRSKLVPICRKCRNLNCISNNCLKKITKTKKKIIFRKFINLCKQAFSFQDITCREVTYMEKCYFFSILSYCLTHFLPTNLTLVNIIKNQIGKFERAVTSQLRKYLL